MWSPHEKIGKKEDIVFVITLRIKRCNIKLLFAWTDIVFVNFDVISYPSYTSTCVQERRIRSERRNMSVSKPPGLI